MSGSPPSQYDIPIASTSGPYYAQPAQNQSEEASSAALASLLQAELIRQPPNTAPSNSPFAPQSPSRHSFHHSSHLENSGSHSVYSSFARSSNSFEDALRFEHPAAQHKRSYEEFRDSLEDFADQKTGQNPSTAASGSGTPNSGRSKKKSKVEGQGNKVGRPRKADNELKRPRYNPREKPTRLRINKPLKADVNEDVWRNIFRYTEPATLLTMRLVCRVFRSILTHEDHIWAENRINIFGEDCPHPPPGLPAAKVAGNSTERTPGLEDGIIDQPPVAKGIQRQYLDLLAGRSCMQCGARKTKRTLWAFLRRWCEKCYKDKTVTISGLKTARSHDPMLFFCIPRAISDKWGSYKAVGIVYSAQDSVWAPTTLLERHVFLQSDVTKLFTEYDAFVQSIADESPETQTEMKKEWRQNRIDAVDQQLIKCKEIEEFTDRAEESTKHDEKSNRDVYTNDRFEFFAEQAAQLEPPLARDALAKIPAVQKAIKEHRHPTVRAWKNLMGKVLSSRAAAEEAVHFEDTYQTASRPYPQKEESRRIDRTSPSLHFIFNIAQEVIEDLAETELADVDFPLVALRRVWEIYNLEKAETDLPRASECELLLPTVAGGPHVLSLHDALKVWDVKIVPHMDKWGPIRSKSAQKLKCPGCTRVDYSKDWSFKGLFYHLQTKHGLELGSDWTDFYRVGLRHNCQTSFPYYAIPWTRNLPILAQHHKATGRWNPHDATPYQYSQETRQRSDHNTPSAFTGRTVRSSLEDVFKTASLAAWAVEAANLLRQTPLPKQYVTLVSWKYMIRRAQAHRDAANPSLPNLLLLDDTLGELLQELMNLGEFSIFEGYCCAACHETDTFRGISSVTVNYGLKGHSFADLILHWQMTHQVRRDFRVGLGRSRNNSSEDTKPPERWTDDLLLLPSEGELTDMLCSPGMEQARETFEWLFPLEADAANVFANRPELARTATTSSSPASKLRSAPSTSHAGKPEHHRNNLFATEHQVLSTRQAQAASTIAPSKSSGLDLLAESALRDDMRLRSRGENEAENLGIAQRQSDEMVSEARAAAAGSEREHESKLTAEEMIAGW